ncbi:hypothetical protein HY061_00475 [Candidatus Azambacteria bacterium]|nr:hypothetical protein [Candidatus Azambacteria bacterium]
MIVRERNLVKKRGLKGESVHYFLSIGKVQFFLITRVDLWWDYPLRYNCKIRKIKWFLSRKRAIKFVFLILKEREKMLKKLLPGWKKGESLGLIEAKKRRLVLLERVYPELKDQIETERQRLSSLKTFPEKR